MELVNRNVPMNFNLFLIGDDHEGTVFRHKLGWESMIDKVLSEYEGIKPRHNLVVDHGDVLEGILIDDPRYDFDTVEGNLLQQMERCVYNRKDIKDQIVVIIDGNHPHRLRKFGNITEDICKRLDVPYGTFQCKIAYNNRGSNLFKQFGGHGWGTNNPKADVPAQRRRTNMELHLKAGLFRKAADVLIMSMGHTHKLLYCKPEPELYLMDDGEELIAKYTKPEKTTGYIHKDFRHYFNTGSFLKLYGEMGISGYGEMAGYDPIENGYWVVMIRNGAISGVNKETL